MKHGANLFWQTILVLLVVLGEIRAAIESATQSLGWSPRLGDPLYVILHMPVYHPLAFFGWWLSFNAYVLDAFNLSGPVTASGGVAAITIALTGFILRVRRAQSKGICNFGPLNLRGTFHDLMQGAHAVVAPPNPQFTDVLIRHIRQRAYCVC